MNSWIRPYIYCVDSAFSRFNIGDRAMILAVTSEACSEVMAIKREPVKNILPAKRIIYSSFDSMMMLKFLLMSIA
jgi:hypothetical protein